MVFRRKSIGWHPMAGFPLTEKTPPPCLEERDGAVHTIRLNGID